MKYPTIFNLIADVFKKAGVSGVLIGGFAVNQYCPPRFTGDIDFLVTEEIYDQILPVLKKTGFREGTRQHLFARLEGNAPDFLDIDFLFVDHQTFSLVVKDGKKENVLGETFIVASLEHLIALKLHSIKNNPKRELADMVDIMNLIRAGKVNVKMKRFRDLCLKYGSQELYEKIIRAI